MISSVFGNLFPKPPKKLASAPKPIRKPALTDKAQDLLSHVEIDVAKLSADLSSRRASDPNLPIIEAVKASCEKIKERIKKEARNSGDLEGFNHLLAFYEAIPRSLRQIQVGSPLCPTPEQFSQTLLSLSDMPVKDVSQLDLNLDFHRMAYDIPSFPNTRNYSRCR